MEKSNHKNEGFEDAMDKALPKVKESKVVPTEEYEAAKEGVKDANKDTPDPKDHVFDFVAGMGKIMIYAPKPKNKSGIELTPETIAQLAQEQKETSTFKVYSIGPDEKQYQVGDMVHLTASDGWVSINIEGFIMKIVENYQIQGRKMRVSDRVYATSRIGHEG